MNFKLKCFAVAGGASGIGAATVKLLWSRGASVAVADIDAEGLRNLREKLEQSANHPLQKILTDAVDVVNSAEVDGWIARVVNEFGQLHGAANVAGKGDGYGLLAEKTDSQFDATMNLNLRGVFNCMRAELNNMDAGASIVNVSSGAGIRGIPGSSLYTAAKHGVNGMTRAAAKEYAPKGIRINSVCPGVTRTPLLDLSGKKEAMQDFVKGTPLNRLAEPEEVANVIVFLLSDEASFQTGALVSVDGGFTS
ncbi:uncharacterized protein CTRU02_200962 [Colletotrichum truncatum]|uniref:Uncharacterized protein n=1 Tax=Colletotrichum truncatum TaxID=5467 RepID=A0ACC3ZG33_COLTU|nr:uncharacterized protein CTRU02_00731 [Colletotrichum truncatum]KAF6801982.1 hypothetical protein CTRU02_00731 [Colletotrichum truncatum]